VSQLSIDKVRFNPIDHPIIFQFPERNSGCSDWWGHVPFAKYIVDALRPKLIVELGVFRGDSFCAFCQAVDTLEFDSRVVGIDAYIGEENTGFDVEELVATLTDFVSKRYGRFATLRRELFDDALVDVLDNSISLLHIDGCHEYEAVLHDYTTWLPKLSENGIILFHDIALGGKGFGVDRLWRDLKAQHPDAWFEFFHSWGLGVLAPKGIPDSMRAFFASTGTPDEERIAAFFHLAGSRNFISTLYRRRFGDATLLAALADPNLIGTPENEDVENTL